MTIRRLWRTRSESVLHHHVRLDRARAGRRQHARALELDHADAADVGGRSVSP